jgi:DNA repair exonuclease SbcCD ATPase subunit
MNDADIIHVNYKGIIEEIAKLQNVEKNLADYLTSFMVSLRELTLKLEPALKRESHEDEQLWNEYTQLQQGKLLVLDLSHEYDNFERQVQSINPNLNVMIKDAIDELSEHIKVRAETHRAHIDLLEIRNTRRTSLSAIIVSATIAYLAVWEYSVREFIGTIVFPSGLSPGLNYALTVLTLFPVFAAVFWALLSRQKRL